MKLEQPPPYNFKSRRVDNWKFNFHQPTHVSELEKRRNFTSWNKISLSESLSNLADEISEHVVGIKSTLLYIVCKTLDQRILGGIWSDEWVIQSDSSANNISELSSVCRADYGLFTLSIHESEKLNWQCIDSKKYKGLYSFLIFSYQLRLGNWRIDWLGPRIVVVFVNGPLSYPWSWLAYAIDRKANNVQKPILSNFCKIVVSLYHSTFSRW